MVWWISWLVGFVVVGYFVFGWLDLLSFACFVFGFDGLGLFILVGFAFILGLYVGLILFDVGFEFGFLFVSVCCLMVRLVCFDDWLCITFI